MSGFEIQVGPELERWASGLGRVRLTDDETLLWNQAMDVYFDETQRRVHVDTGDLKASGRTEPADRGDTFVVGTVKYGGVMGMHGFVDYAWYEFRRGGAHDPILPAVTRMESMFSQKLNQAIQQIVRRATGG